METATCTRCKQTKDKTAFTCERRNRSGVKSWCKVCCSEHLTARLASDESLREARRQYARQRRQSQDVVERDRASAIAWNVANAVKHRANAKRWKESNIDAVREVDSMKNAKRRLRKVAWADRRKILEVYKKARELTAKTGIPYHVDHVIPLLGRRVSGLHVPENLQIIPASENIRKGNSHGI